MIIQDDKLNLAIWSTIELTAIPALTLIFGAITVFLFTFPNNVVSGLQHFAAGIVICAVCVELIPTISASDATFGNLMAITCGFLAGVLCMLGIQSFCEAEEENHDDDDSVPSPSMPLNPNRGISQNNYRQLIVYGTENRNLSPETSLVGTTSRSGRSRRSLQILARTSSTIELPSSSVPYPVTLGFAVCVDSFVDGLLIGISQNTGENAGAILAIALSIEMCFLGLTFATGLTKLPAWKSTISIVVAASMLICGGVLGATSAAMLESNPEIKLGLLSFGVAALLFLVTEELLLEAHEQLSEDHVFWVDLLFFVGFWVCLILDKLGK